MLGFHRHVASIPLSAVLALMSVVPSHGQDANIESRLDTVLPEPETPVLKPEVETVIVTRTRRVRVGSKIVQDKLTDPQILTMLKDKGISTVRPSAGTPKTPCEMARDALLSCTKPRKVPLFKTYTRKETDTRTKPRTITLSASIPNSYSYTSNALSSPVARADWIMSVAPEMTLKIPVGKEDTLSFYGSLGFVRYDEFDRQNQDALLGVASYAHVLTPQQTLTAKLTARSSWAPGFDGSPTTFYRPAGEWMMDKIDLGGPTCGTGKTAKKCFLWRITASAGHTFFDAIPGLDNTFASAQGGLDWAIMPGLLDVKVSMGITGRHYGRNVFDREDLVFDGSTRVEWNPRKGITVSGGFSYIHQDSSLEPLEFTGYQLIPQIRLSMDLGEWKR